MMIPFANHRRIYEARRAEFEDAIIRTLRKGLDDELEISAFEAEFAAWNGASNAVSVQSGTASIRLALLALGIGPGDEVITVPNTDVCTSAAIRQTGATLVWIDVDAVTRTMDPAALERAITPRTRAVVAVDLFGHPARMREIMTIAGRHGIHVVEDACLALGATVDGVKVGTTAHATCFSFAQKKHLGSFGSGGAVLTEDPALTRRLRTLSSYGEAPDRHGGKTSLDESAWFWAETEGTNLRLDEIQAAILRIKLRDLDGNLALRRRQAARYSEALRGSAIETPVTSPGMEHAWRNYVVEADDREAFRARLAEKGVSTTLHYAPALYRQPAFADMEVSPEGFPVVERICSRLFAIPIGPHLSEAEEDQIVAALETLRS